MPDEERALIHPMPKDGDKVEEEQNRIRAQILADQKAVAAPVEDMPVAPHQPIDGKADNDPELASIQQENPMAYGMVKALLLKKSMGLIKSRSDDDGLPPAPEHHGPVDMFSWKPHDSAADLVQDDGSSPPLSLSVSSATVTPASDAPKPQAAGGLAAYLGVHKQQVRVWDVNEDSAQPPEVAPAVPAAPEPAPVEAAAVEAPAPVAPVVQAVQPEPTMLPPKSPPKSMWDWQPSDSATDLLSVDPDNKGARVTSQHRAAQGAPEPEPTVPGVQSAQSVLSQFMDDLD